MNARRCAPLAVCLIALAAGCTKSEEAAVPAVESAPAVEEPARGDRRQEGVRISFPL